MSDIDSETVMDWFDAMPNFIRAAAPAGAPEKVMLADGESIFQMFSEASGSGARIDALLDDLGAVGWLYVLARLANAYKERGNLISELGQFISEHQAAQAIAGTLTVTVGQQIMNTLGTDDSYLRMMAAATPKPNPMMAMIGLAVR